MGLTRTQRGALIFVLVSVVVGSFVGLVTRLGPNGVAAPVPVSPASPMASGLALVYVSGAVAAPGLYQVQAGSRVAEVLQLAGGMRADADSDRVNLAAQVYDGGQVCVPVRQPPPAYQPPAGVARERVEPLPTTPAPGDQGGGQRRKAAARARTPVSWPLNINAATPDQLEALPGIGPVLAARIVEYRQQHGPFHGAEDLAQVPGLGPLRLGGIAPYVTF
jgi:competence protein ComEA